MKKIFLKNNKIIVPNHVAIIMDGNKRWSLKNKLTPFSGHERGIKSIEIAIKNAKFFGIKYLTLYSFSSENWSRPKKEILFLMKLLRKYMESKFDYLLNNDISIKMIGEKDRLPNDIVKKIVKYENLTKKNKSLHLIFALNYGSRKEITISIQNLVKKIIKKKINLKLINEKLFSSNLYTAGIPDPDLLIRTSGEKRLSNFLLWQSAYTEFVFLNVLWPDFRKKHFVNALIQYSKRKRRYGARV